MNNKRRFSFDAVLVLGTVGSVALGIVFFVWDERNAVALATMAGLLGMILTFQVEIMLREKQRAEFESKSGAVVARLEQLPWLGDVVNRMTESMVIVEDEYTDTPAIEEGRRIFQDASGKLAELEAGRFGSDWDDNGIVMDLVHDLKREMLATSVPSIDLEWWKSPEGQQYWSLQEKAIQRGVSIRRVFIYDTWTDEIDDMARTQRSAGAKVGRVHSDKLKNLACISAIWDSKIAIEVESVLGTGGATEFAYYVAPSGIDRIKRRYERIERLAEGLDGEPDITQ